MSAGAPRHHKKVWDTLELELWVILGSHMGNGTWIPVLCKSYITLTAEPTFQPSTIFQYTCNKLQN